MLVIEPQKYLILSISSILESLSLLISTCLICNIIPKSFKKFCDKLEATVSESALNDSLLSQLYKHSLINRIYTIKKEIGFTASNLFKISTYTVISCLGLILSYSVILIQTSAQK